MREEPPWSSRLWSLVERRSTGIGLCLLLMYVTLAAVSVARDSATTDEAFHLRFGANLLAGKLEHADMQRMPVSALNAIPHRICRELGIRLSAEGGLFVSRLPTLIFPALLGWFIFVWSRRLYGPRGGLLSLVVFFFCPTILAHGRLITNDVSCALLFFLAELSFLDYLRRPTWPRLVLTAVLAGLAQLTKQTALLLFPVFFVILVLRAWALRRTPRWGLPRYPGARALLFLVIVVVCINAGYRWKGTGESLERHEQWLQATTAGYPPTIVSSGNPADDLKAWARRLRLPLPRVYVETLLVGQHYNRTNQGHGWLYLLGQRGLRGWKSYFPIAFLLKTPLPILALIGAALVVSLRTRRLHPFSDELVCLLSAVVSFATFTFLCTAQIGVRYLLPVLPFLYVFVGQLAVWRPFHGRGLWRAGGLTAMFWLALSSLSYFPHYISYFNEICWDRRYLYKYLADSNLDWDQSRRYLEQYLKLHPGENIPVNPPQLPTGTFIVRTNSLVGLDFDPTAYQALREKHTPVEHVAYSYLVYRLPPPPTDAFPPSP